MNKLPNDENLVTCELQRERNKNDYFLFQKLVRCIGWPQYSGSRRMTSDFGDVIVCELRRERNKNDNFLFQKLVRRIGCPHHSGNRRMTSDFGDVIVCELQSTDRSFLPSYRDYITLPLYHNFLWSFFSFKKEQCIGVNYTLLRVYIQGYLIP